MKVWEAIIIIRWREKRTVNVAAATFAQAVEKVNAIARRRMSCRRPEFVSLTRTATLDG
jgi:hypothetical protein